jgi:hypothetical protein
MADAELPLTWAGAARSALGNSLWILPLVAIERLVEGYLGQAGVLGIGWLVAIAVAVQLHVFQDIISTRERQRQLLTWALILGGAVFLGLGIYRLALTSASIPASNLQSQLDAAISERDQAKRERDAEKQSHQDQLVATKAELEKIRQELAAAKAARPSDAPPAPNPGHVDYRRLSPEQMRILIREFSRAKTDIPRVLFTHFPDFQGEAPQYMRDFMEAFRRAGIIAADNGQQNIAEAGQEGIFLCVPDVKKPPVAAEKISKALDAASIAYEFVPLEPGRSEFTFFIGPNPL